MKKMTSQLALALAVFGLVGCGLKGPLYFPKDETTKSQTTQTSSPTQSGSSVSAGASTGQDVQPVQ